MATDARFSTNNGFPFPLFAKPLPYLALIVLACLLAITPPALAQIASYRDTNGWTVFTPVSGAGSCSTGSYTGTCIVYVSSSSGNDLTCAPVAATSRIVPCRTLDRAVSLLRNSHPDWLLLKRGDTFLPDSHGNNFGRWTLNGASAKEPMVIGSYDPTQPGVVDPYVSGSRPLIENNQSTGPFGTAGSSGGDYLAMVGLEFYNYTADPNNSSYNAHGWSAQVGVDLGANFLDWVMIEDCKFSFYQDNVTIEPLNNANPAARTSVAILNRNVVLNSYNTGGDSSGAYIGTAAGNSSVANLYVTENIFDHNGWNAAVSGANPAARNHNIYIECLTSTVQPTNSVTSVTNNIFSNDASSSAMRLPGAYNSNLFVYVPGGVNFGVGTGTTSCDTPPALTANDNVVIASNYNSIIGGGGSFGTTNLSSVSIKNNITSTYASTSLFGYSLQINTPNANNTFTNNTIWDWANNVQDNGGTGDVTAPNNYNCTTCFSGGAYPDPYRSLGSYYATLSGATSSAVVTGTINNCSPSCAGSTTAGNIMNVTAVTSGTLNIGDAITFPGQTQAVVITGNSTIGSNLCGGSACTGTGGTGTYAVDIAVGSCTSSTWSSCSSFGAIPMLVMSQTLTDYSGQSLITLEHSQAKSNWNSAIAACATSNYIRAGFGQSAQSCPAGG